MSNTPRSPQANLRPRRELSPVSPRRNPSPRVRRALSSEPNDPLLDTETVNPSGPPIAGPETDIESDDRETIASQPGVDDGFFDNPPKTNGREKPVNPGIPELDGPDLGRYPAHHPRRHPEFPYAPGYGPDITYNVPDYAPTEFGNGESIPDVNAYQQKKTLAQGMMDLALFSANANQLRYVLESYDRHPYYYPSIVLISISLIVQVAVGVGLIWNSHYNVKDQKQICIANKISNMTIIGIFVVTVVNVFISAFGVANAPVVPVVGPRSGDIEVDTALLATDNQ